jgi:hypothetical protein
MPAAGCCPHLPQGASTADVLYGGSAGLRAPGFAGATGPFARVTPGGGSGSGAKGMGSASGGGLAAQWGVAPARLRLWRPARWSGRGSRAGRRPGLPAAPTAGLWIWVVASLRGPQRRLSRRKLTDSRSPWRLSGPLNQTRLSGACLAHYRVGDGRNAGTVHRVSSTSRRTRGSSSAPWTRFGHTAPARKNTRLAPEQNHLGRHPKQDNRGACNRPDQGCQ